MPNLDTATPEEMKAWIDYLETKVEKLQGDLEYTRNRNQSLTARLNWYIKRDERT